MVGIEDGWVGIIPADSVFLVLQDGRGQPSGGSGCDVRDVLPV